MWMLLNWGWFIFGFIGLSYFWCQACDMCQTPQMRPRKSPSPLFPNPSLWPLLGSVPTKRPPVKVRGGQERNTEATTDSWKPLWASLAHSRGVEIESELQQRPISSVQLLVALILLNILQYLLLTHVYPKSILRQGCQVTWSTVRAASCSRSQRSCPDHPGC
jgi:hypothetical protein